MSDLPVLERSVLLRFCDSDIEAFPRLEVDSPLLPELSVESEEWVGLTDLEASSNRVYA